ncbi:MAG: hypothetical protein U0572_10930 [Phycisphaerales bacterium]
MSPAITRTLVDVGLGSAVVGRTPFCAAAPASVPVVGSLLDVDVERLVAVRPTTLLVQPAAAGIDPTLVDLANRHDWTLAQWKLDRLADVERMLEELPASIGGASDGVVVACGRRRAGLAALERTPVANDAPRALLIVSVDPMSAAGRATFLDELIRGCGYRNAIEAGGYPDLSHEDLMRLAPDVIVVLRDRPPDASEAEHIKERVLADDALRARDESRFAIFADADVMLPSSAIVDVAARLKTLVDSVRAPCASEVAR